MHAVAVADDVLLALDAEESLLPDGGLAPQADTIQLNTYFGAETDPTQKLRLKDQSMAYLKFAGRRARELRTPRPSFPLLKSLWRER